MGGVRVLRELGGGLLSTGAEVGMRGGGRWGGQL